MHLQWATTPTPLRTSVSACPLYAAHVPIGRVPMCLLFSRQPRAQFLCLPYISRDRLSISAVSLSKAGGWFESSLSHTLLTEGGDPAHPLPAWPMRAACAKMPLASSSRRASSEILRGGGDVGMPAGGTKGGGGGTSMPELLEGLRDAAGVMYNVTGSVRCYSLDPSGPAAGNVGPWGEAAGRDEEGGGHSPPRG